MDMVMEKLVGFVQETGYDDLPQEVVKETKRVLLDSLGCALCGHWMDRGKIAVRLARRLGGRAESSIIGPGDKVSFNVAAFCNGELMNTQDFDAILGNHIPPNVIPAPLAMAESAGASGKELIRAISLGQEISQRVMSALSGWWETTPDETSQGHAKLVWPPVHGFSATVFGATAGVGIILGLNLEEMANALGIGAYMCGPSTMRKWAHTTPVRMAKYGFSGWTGQAACHAALLAQMGYTGDTDVFDTDYGFWRFIGSDRWEPDKIFNGLGSEWHCHKISYKQYPAGWCLGGQLDLFTDIFNENNLRPDDIKMVKVRPTPVGHWPAWKENNLLTQEDIGFNVSYRIACIAYGIRNVDLPDERTRNDSHIRKFMKKVHASVDDPDYAEFERDFATEMNKEPAAKLSEVEVILKNGRSILKTARYRKGSWYPDDYRNTDKQLFEKFYENAKLALPIAKIQKARENLFKLEELKDVAELIETVVV